jgi:hypothetical protein
MSSAVTEYLLNKPDPYGFVVHQMPVGSVPLHVARNGRGVVALWAFGCNDHNHPKEERTFKYVMNNENLSDGLTLRYVDTVVEIDVTMHLFEVLPTNVHDLPAGATLDDGTVIPDPVLKYDDYDLSAQAELEAEREAAEVIGKEATIIRDQGQTFRDVSDGVPHKYVMKQGAADLEQPCGAPGCGKPFSDEIHPKLPDDIAKRPTAAGTVD